jgi:hypothetical protein
VRIPAHTSRAKSASKVEAIDPKSNFWWLEEAFALARDHAYGILPQPNGNGVYVLDARYVAVAVQDVRLQLAKAGVRLGTVLNEALKMDTDHSRTMFSMAVAIPLLD